MTSTRSHAGDEREDGPDLFTKLCIKAVDTDTGSRPIAAVGWLSPSITFVPDPPLPVGQPAKIRITVHNFGTMDATGCFLELAYNIFIGNNNQGMVPLPGLTLPTIGAGEAHTAEVDWTPPDTDAVHACVHARVFDSYSLFHFPARCLEWDSLINPQAGNKNLTLQPITAADQAAIVRFTAFNDAPFRLKARVLMTNITDRDVAERGLAAVFPLPFLLERLPAHLFQDEKRLELPPLGNRNGDDVTTPSKPSWKRFFGGRRTGPWPTEMIDERYVHARYGLVTDVDPADDAKLGAADRRSLGEIVLDPGEKRVLPFVVPAEELPPRGRRVHYQIHYQANEAMPIVMHAFLGH